MGKDKKLGMVIVKDYELLNNACEKAMAQIEEENHTAKLQQYGYKRILTYGISFCEKSCKVLVKEIND